MEDKVMQRQSSFMDQLGIGVGAGLAAGMQSSSQRFAQQMQVKEENEALKRFGVDLSGISDPDLRKTLIQNVMKKKVDDTQKFSSGIETLNQMKEILNRGNIGWGSGLKKYLSSAVASDSAEYAALGRSVIPLTTAGLRITNKNEFEEFKKVITDPTAREAEIEGAINGLMSIFTRKLEEDDNQISSIMNPQSTSSRKMKFDISNPEHKAKRDQLLKKFKGDRQKTMEALSREFEE